LYLADYGLLDAQGGRGGEARDIHDALDLIFREGCLKNHLGSITLVVTHAPPALFNPQTSQQRPPSTKKIRKKIRDSFAMSANDPIYGLIAATLPDNVHIVDPLDVH